MDMVKSVDPVKPAKSLVGLETTRRTPDLHASRACQLINFIPSRLKFKHAETLEISTDVGLHNVCCNKCDSCTVRPVLFPYLSSVFVFIMCVYIFYAS